MTREKRNPGAQCAIDVILFLLTSTRALYKQTDCYTVGLKDKQERVKKLSYHCRSILRRRCGVPRDKLGRIWNLCKVFYHFVGPLWSDFPARGGGFCFRNVCRRHHLPSPPATSLAQTRERDLGHRAGSCNERTSEPDACGLSSLWSIV